MDNNTKRIFVAAFVVISVLAPLAALAQIPSPYPIQVLPPVQNVGVIHSGNGIVDFFNNILAWAATIFWILAALFIFYAAYLYLTAGGDSEKVSTASTNLLYAVIAIVVGLMAYGLPLLLKNILQGK